VLRFEKICLLQTVGTFSRNEEQEDCEPLFLLAHFHIKKRAFMARFLV